MSTVALSQNHCIPSPSIIDYFIYTINKYFDGLLEAIKKLPDELFDNLFESTKSSLLTNAEELGRILLVFAKNPIPITEKDIADTQKILDWMEGCLDSKENLYRLTSEQRHRLESSYQNISQYLCMILIRQADTAKDLEA